MLLEVFTAKATDWHQPKCPPMGEWINKLWHIHTMQYDYSAVEGMMDWMNLRVTVLSESSQTQKDHILTDSVYMTFV